MAYTRVPTGLIVTFYLAQHISLQLGWFAMQYSHVVTSLTVTLYLVHHKRLQ